MGSYPPPFNPAPPKGNSNTKVILIILGLVAFLCLGGIVAMGLFGWNVFKKGIAPIAGCGLGFDNIRTAMKDYAKEHGDKLPPAATWQDDVRPYLIKVLKATKEQKGGIIPEVDPGGSWGCEDGKDGRTGIAYNSDVAGKKIAEIKTPDQTILLYEVPEARQNLAAPYKKPDDAKRPMMMGKERPFLTVNVEGGKDEFKFEAFNNKDWENKK